MADLDGLLEVRRLVDRVVMRRLADADTRALAPLVDAPTVSAWLRAQDAPVARTPSLRPGGCLGTVPSRPRSWTGGCRCPPRR